jgi:hypothetical protein
MEQLLKRDKSAAYHSIIGRDPASGNPDAPLRYKTQIPELFGTTSLEREKPDNATS